MPGGPPGREDPKSKEKKEKELRNTVLKFFGLVVVLRLTPYALQAAGIDTGL